MTNLVTEVADAVTAHPTEAAIVYGGSTTTYETFWERTGRFAAALADRGVEPGDRVAIYLPNLPQFVTAFYGTLRAGGIVVPMNPQYKAREISHLLSDSGATAVVTLAENAAAVDSVREETDVEHVVSVGGAADGATDFESFLADETLPIVDRADDDVAVQPYTSGTTGTPKGVLLSHHNLAWTSRTNAELLDGGLGPDDGLVGTLPLFHIYGMSVVMNAALVNGAAYYPVTEWDAAEVMTAIDEDELTVMYGVPAMFNDMINQPDADSYDLGSLRFVNSGGASLPIEVLERFEALFDAELYEGYGLTETSPTTHANKPGARRPGSIGKPLDGVDAKIVAPDFTEQPRVERGPVGDETDLDDVIGELVVAGPNVMQGYYGLPEANESAFTEADGARWFHTGDLGYWDEGDYFYVVDRDKHMIVTGGYNVYPREIEELLYEHPDIAEAAVVGVPDERRGETVKAFVVPVPDAELTGEAVTEYCLDALAAYKHPREVAIVDELPRTTTGKVQKFELESASE
ncbi:long-chain-fatty-acid--CoA ligase [Halorarius litoreus]|uniref:long-chain-fatty-acid--CoA ligase n=1 Tax=Halorarius litoreus TaxID=2962676 RepID=UPI0020CB72BB|nr:long-chain fatty acid--CoA ligase [Halorarius litoreus]